MFETIKQHPVISVGVLLAGVAVIVIMNSGGSSSAVVASSDPTGSAFLEQQQQMQYQLAGINAQVQAKAADNAAQIELAKISGQYSYDIANLSAGVQTAKINADAQTSSLQSTLLAQTQQKGIQADVDKTSITTTGAVDMARVYSDTVIAQANASASVAQAAIAASSKCHGLGCIFG